MAGNFIRRLEQKLLILSVSSPSLKLPEFSVDFSPNAVIYAVAFSLSLRDDNYFALKAVPAIYLLERREMEK